MAYDEYLGNRIQQIMKLQNLPFYEKKMMGGLIFMVDNKMCCGIHINKKYGDSLLMARIGERAYEEHIHKSECLPMDFTGRAMKGYVFITPDGFDLDEDLNYWIQLALAYNSQIPSKKG